MPELTKEDHDRLRDSLTGMNAFGMNEKVADDEKIWITKREAYLITDFIAWLIKRYYRDQDVPEEQQG
jgi:hypothetical protein